MNRISNHACYNCLPQICTKMNGFKFDFSKISGEGLTELSPQTSLPFFPGFTLSSGFALNSQALHAFDSAFALDSRALRALFSGFALNFRLQNMVWPLHNKFLDLPLDHPYEIHANPLKLDLYGTKCFLFILKCTKIRTRPHLGAGVHSVPIYTPIPASSWNQKGSNVHNYLVLPRWTTSPTHGGSVMVHIFGPSRTVFIFYF